MTPGSTGWGSRLANAARWPFWSWRRVWFTCAVVLMLALAAGRMAGRDQRETTPPAAPKLVAPSTSSTYPAASPPTSGAGSGTPAALPSPQEEDVAPDVQEAARATAERFVYAWVSMPAGNARTQQLERNATADAVASVTEADPSNLPKAVGEYTVRSVDPAEAVVSVPMDDGRTCVLTLHAEMGQWQVAKVSASTP